MALHLAPMALCRAPCRVLPLLLLLGAASAFDIRVSKGHWARDYYSVRVSAIGSAADVVQPPLAYHSKFAQRWTDKTLDSQVFRIEPEGQTLNIGGQPIFVKLPAPGSSVKGFLVADPCHSSGGGFGCPNGERFQIKEKMAKIIDLLVGSDDFHFWAILGDNFYDTWGRVSSEFFAAVGNAAKAKPFVTVPGNHDYWLAGAPGTNAGDQYGWGFMQFYAQDTVAGQGGAPFDLGGSADAHQIPKAENFIFGHVIGDLAMFGFSGAHEWAATEPHARSFCNHVAQSPHVNTVAVLGHWDAANLGCKPGMNTPIVYEQVRGMPGCSGKIVLYFDGHQHCNKVTGWGSDKAKHPDNATGFMIGAAGMYGDGCSEFGFSVIHTLPDVHGGPNVRVDSFKIGQDLAWGDDHRQVQSWFDDVYSCFKAHGYEACRQRYATPFRSTLRSIHGSYDCSNASTWEQWTASHKEWCCKNTNVGCGGCDSKCDFYQPGTCRSKIDWLNFVAQLPQLKDHHKDHHHQKHHRVSKAHSCAASVRKVLKECPACSQCTREEMKCPVKVTTTRTVTTTMEAPAKVVAEWLDAERKAPMGGVPTYAIAVLSACCSVACLYFLVIRRGRPSPSVVAMSESQAALLPDDEAEAVVEPRGGGYTGPMELVDEASVPTVPQLVSEGHAGPSELADEAPSGVPRVPPRPSEEPFTGH